MRSALIVGVFVALIIVGLMILLSLSSPSLSVACRVVNVSGNSSCCYVEPTAVCADVGCPAKDNGYWSGDNVTCGHVIDSLKVM